MEQNKSEYAIEMLNITKSFLDGKIIASDDITLRVKVGEIHALIGENGAGKSTLMSILFGLYNPNYGVIKINGKTVNITNPIKANELEIGMVHQHFKLIDIYTVTKNIILGSEQTILKQWLNLKLAKSKILEISNKYNLAVDPDAKIADISVGMQQRVEIIKMLYKGADILVFDEPTAVLTPSEIEGLLQVMKELKASGKTIIFITHKLDEVKKVADSATVIRRGKVVETFLVKDKSEKQMAESMVGRNLVEVKNTGEYITDKTLLAIKDLSVEKIGKKGVVGLDKFNLEVKAGEIVAIAGVEGNGQTELIQAISGLEKPTSGGIYFADKNVTWKSISSKYRLGMSHIPEDRHKHGLILDYNILYNMVLQNLNQFPFSKYGVLRSGAIKKYGQEIIYNFDVRGAYSGYAIARGLSGGNQQKAIVGREITRDHKIMLVVQPTRGLDIGAIEYIHEQILKEKAKGNAVLLVSYELEEVMMLADRIVVLHGGKKTGEVLGKNANRTDIGLMMAGQKKQKEEVKAHDEKVSLNI